MSAIPYPLDPLGKYSPYFQIIVKPGILDNSLTYGFTPYWNAGGYCKVVDWGDGSGEDATASGTKLTHTYAAAGTYTISIKADCYRVYFGVWPNQILVYDSNGNWDALGNITNGDSMFSNCGNAKLSFTTLPACLQKAPYMFFNCSKAELCLTELPAGLTDARYMFQTCKKAKFNFTELPDSITIANGMFALDNSTQDISPLHITHLSANLTNGQGMFSRRAQSEIAVSELPSGLKNGNSMFYDCRNASLPLTSLPDGLTAAERMFFHCPEAQLDLQELPESLSGSIVEMFYHCIKSKLNFTTLPNGITSAYSTFRDCYEAELQITSLPESLVTMTGIFENCKKARINLTKLPRTVSGSLAIAFSHAKLAVINLDELAANAPEGGWTEVTSIKNMFYNAGSGNSPGTVTGSRSAFLAKLPNVTNTTDAFYGTNTTD